jgi:hypothetical protein
MKYIKKYEMLKDERTPPKIGDYVIVKSANCDIVNFTDINIGQIINIKKDDHNRTLIGIKYENIPPNIIEFFYEEDDFDCIRYFGINQIKYLSSNKFDLETVLKSTKYNL